VPRGAPPQPGDQRPTVLSSNLAIHPSPFAAAERLKGLGTTVFSEVNQLATAFGAINLGQGAPSFDGPEWVKEAAIAAIRAGHNQYCRSAGLPALARAIAAHQRRFYDLDYDPEAEVTVYAGATEAIFATLQALVEPGDEVIAFEPFYDSYLASARMAGAELKTVTLAAPGFGFDSEELARAVTPRTRLILVNSPHNPTGRVFRREELAAIAELCRRHDLVAVSDEVYEHLVFEGEHLPLAALPGMRERTITISSTGKTFSLTGWKIGYTCAPAEISLALRGAHQFITFCQATPFQHAMAVALAAEDAYYADYLAHYRQRRDRFCQGLAAAGFGVRPPEGTYFVLADIRPLGFADDLAFCRMLPEKVGVAAIPPSSFYLNRERGRHLVRFAFCKDLALLDEAIRRLEGLTRIER
jgi:N-succinyldiaminopimelate aminotransferase